ncbi:hypothetical protein [Denitrificimonas caeni]|uniref:hypothetical protein n=1 Tax=Denitrificimonas caeni TaxID=521720 RepID=UPI00196545CB|nr:hypothetical protein [Denitrificimonas caeni]
MSEHDVLLGEKFPHKVSAQYNSQESADRAAQLLVDNAELPRNQIRIVQPYDPNMARKIEPESKGIARTLVKSHTVLGIGGLVLGLLIAAILVSIGPVMTRSSPMFTFIALGFLFSFLGLILGGAISLRPDHDPLIEKTRTATDTGHWTVIAHCTTIEQQTRVKDTIDYSSQTL